VEVADALGDIVFTAYGMAARHGIDLDRVLAAICESNMSKTANGQNKILKGEDYFPPRIAEALAV
jgi:predicted HAD superfamily Cof-like phosphohydrolase